MTVLEKINYLMKEKELNKRQLSIQANIPYSTLNNLWVRGTDSMRLPTFRAICDFFGVTMDSMAYDDREIVYKKDVKPVDFAPEQRRIANAYNSADDGTKTAVAKLLDVKRDVLTETEMRDSA